MRYAAWLVALALLVGLGFWMNGAKSETNSMAPRAGAARRADVRASNGSIQWAAGTSPRGQRLLASDVDLIELALEEGALPTPEGVTPLRYAVRISKRTLALQEPLEATLTVLDTAGKSRPFRVVSKDIIRVDGGFSEPGGSWSEQATAKARF